MLADPHLTGAQATTTMPPQGNRPCARIGHAESIDKYGIFAEESRREMDAVTGASLS
jgi:hypothetical protein